MAKEYTTISEWFEKLPKSIGKKAIQNTNKENLEAKAPSMSSALGGAFSWKQSHEGYDYWKYIYQSYHVKAKI